MPNSLIESQFATLEDPLLEPNAIELDIREDGAELCRQVEQVLDIDGVTFSSDVDFRLNPHLGLIGLGVMGQNLAFNIADKGYALHSWDVDESRRRAYCESVSPISPDSISSGLNKVATDQGKSVKCHDSMEELVSNTVSPRSILLMIKAGKAVDDVMQRLLPLLDRGDVVVDLGNSHYKDTDRRCELAGNHGVRFVGCGISGGSEGARWGALTDAWGDQVAARMLRGLFADVAASYGGEPCVAWIGPAGAGHFVKMVHNGIEYADMQLISEAYHLMRKGLGMESAEIAATFSRWNRGPLESYLIQATAKIFTAKEPDGTALVERILDRAGQKGTGSWAVEASLESGVPATQISDAVFARIISSLKTDRQRYAKLYELDRDTLLGSELSETGLSETAKKQFIDELELGLYCAKVISYIQGFMLMANVSKQRDWNLNFMKIASIWRAGCIIRGGLLHDIVDAYRQNMNENTNTNLLEALKFQQVLRDHQGAMREVVKFGVGRGIPLPNFVGALTFFDSIRTASLPANLIQAQRDYFGAHTFERTDQPEGQFFHANWDELIQESNL
ncbi:MAG: NADP-dependent phosphogluconate dehydrogenase [Gammaproteobacteria bacterium]|nr:NADP-dependent phosphogluconate dehydrogenase [Gammaproteobacteria bacterium]